MKIKFLIVATVLSTLTLQMFAGHNSQSRRSCTGLPKYKAVAKITNPNGRTWNNDDTGCGYAHARINSKEQNLTDGTDANGFANAESDVYIGNDGFNAVGFNYNGWNYGENVVFLQPTSSFSPIVESQNYRDRNFTKNGYKGDAVIFDEVNHTVIFKNLSAFLTVISKDLKNDYTTLQFKVFTEGKDAIGNTIREMLWSAKASIINGELLLEGDFKRSEFSNESKGKEINYILSKNSKTIKLDESVNFDNLVIEMSGDGGNLGRGVINDFAPDLTSNEGQTIKAHILSETNFNFDILRKSQQIEFNVTKNIINAQIEEVAILTSEGKMVKPMKIDSNKAAVKTLDLSNGVYYVRYLIDGNYYLKKFII